MFQNYQAPYQKIQQQQSNESSISMITEVKGCKIFLGDLEGAKNLALLTKNNIKAVLTVCREAELNYDPKAGIQHLFTPVSDRPEFDIQQCFNQTHEFIVKATQSGKSVLVHCFLGKSRSTAIVLAYLMKSQKMNLEQALQLVRSKRPLIDPNPGFVRQLLEFEKKLYGGISSKLTRNLTQYYQVQDLPHYKPTIAQPQQMQKLQSPQPQKTPQNLKSPQQQQQCLQSTQSSFQQQEVQQRIQSPQQKKSPQDTQQLQSLQQRQQQTQSQSQYHEVQHRIQSPLQQKSTQLSQQQQIIQQRLQSAQSSLQQQEIQHRYQSPLQIQQQSPQLAQQQQILQQRVQQSFKQSEIQHIQQPQQTKLLEGPSLKVQSMHLRTQRPQTPVNPVKILKPEQQYPIDNRRQTAQIEMMSSQGLSRQILRESNMTYQSQPSSKPTMIKGVSRIVSPFGQERGEVQNFVRCNSIASVPSNFRQSNRQWSSNNLNFQFVKMQ